MCSVYEMAQSQQNFLKQEAGQLSREDTLLKMADHRSSWSRVLADNKLILITLSGVLLGVIIGECRNYAYFTIPPKKTPILLCQLCASI